MSRIHLVQYLNFQARDDQCRLVAYLGLLGAVISIVDPIMSGNCP